MLSFPLARHLQMFMYVNKKRRGRTEGACVCLLLSFSSIKQSFFSSPGFKKNLVPGREPTLTLKLSLCCSMAPIVVSRDLFTMINQKNSTWNYFCIIFFNFFPPIPLFCFPPTSIFCCQFVSKSRVTERQPSTTW